METDRMAKAVNTDERLEKQLEKALCNMVPLDGNKMPERQLEMLLSGSVLPGEIAGSDGRLMPRVTKADEQAMPRTDPRPGSDRLGAAPLARRRQPQPGVSAGRITLFLREGRMTAHAKECPFCGEAMETQAEMCPSCGKSPAKHPSEPALDDGSEPGDMLISPDTANGRPAQDEQTADAESSVIEVKTEPVLGDSRRAAQYEIVLHWDGARSLRGFDLAECNLSGFELQNADLCGANLLGADLRGADLRGANLSEADLRGADLREAKLNKAEMVGSDLSWADLRGADLCGADLGKANVSKAELHGANLSWANLSSADLYIADLSEANLNVVNLGRANLNVANLSGARLSGAYLGGANLCEADLSGANLCGAYLGGAQLGGAALRDAVLKEARVTDEQLAQAESLEGATMPNGARHR
jgi:uncharacterized protein YjbI with pentapeptide repeats